CYAGSRPYLGPTSRQSRKSLQFAPLPSSSGESRLQMTYQRRARESGNTSADPSSAGLRTMRAARIHQWGSPDVITVESVAVPERTDQELLVRVHAAGVGPWDALARSGKIGLPLTLPLTLGSEVSGVVEKIGAKTTGFAVGDEVFGATNPSFIEGYPEYASVAARMVAS